MRVVVLLVVVVVVTTGKQSQLPGLALDGSLTINTQFAIGSYSCPKYKMAMDCSGLTFDHVDILVYMYVKNKCTFC